MTTTRGARALLCVALAATLAGCARRVDVEKVPIGTAVEVTRQDGGVLRGTLASRDDQNVRLAIGRTTRSVARDQIAEIAIVGTDAPTRLPSSAMFREYTLTSGTVLHARLETALGSDSSRVNDPVEAALTEAESVDGVEVLPEGSLVSGVVTTADASGNVAGRASLAVQFHSITLPGREGTYVMSSSVHHTAAATKGSDARKIGIPAAGGALLGALLGGKKGALIGTAIGGGAGAVVVLTTSGPEVRYARGTTLSLPLDQAIDVRVPIRR